MEDKSNISREWTGVTHGGSLGLKMVMFVFRHVSAIAGRFSVIIGYCILAPVIPFYMLFARKSYLSIYRYFRIHFSYSPLKSFYKTYINHFIFGQCMFDRFAAFVGRRNFFTAKITGKEEFFNLADEEKGFIMASAHVGNFELSGCLFGQDKKHINVLAFGGENEEVMINRMKIFETNNVSIIPVTDDISYMLRVKKAFSSGEILAALCDRIYGNTKTIECDFLSGKADFPTGIFALAVYFNVPIISTFVMKNKLTKYNIYIKKISLNKSENSENLTKQDKIELLTHKFVEELDNIVKKYPEQWFNFYEFWNLR